MINPYRAKSLFINRFCKFKDLMGIKSKQVQNQDFFWKNLGPSAPAGVRCSSLIEQFWQVLNSAALKAKTRFAQTVCLLTAPLHKNLYTIAINDSPASHPGLYVWLEPVVPNLFSSVGILKKYAKRRNVFARFVKFWSLVNILSRTLSEIVSDETC